MSLEIADALRVLYGNTHLINSVGTNASVSFVTELKIVGTCWEVMSRPCELPALTIAAGCRRQMTESQNVSAMCLARACCSHYNHAVLSARTPEKCDLRSNHTCVLHTYRPES